MTKKFVDTTNPSSRPTGEYANVIQKIAEHGVCPFCAEHLEKYHKLPLVQKAHWTLTDNMYPYKPSLHHKLIIHKEHIEHISEIKPEAWNELHEIIKAETARLDIKGGTFIIRFGETHFTGASVSHLHAHIVQSNPENPDYDQKKGLVMRIG